MCGGIEQKDVADAFLPFFFPFLINLAVQRGRLSPPSSFISIISLFQPSLFFFQHHYSISGGASAVGLGTENCVQVPCDVK